MIKRVLDICMTFVALTILMPIILITAALVFVSFGNPIIFSQTRPGYLGRPFKIYKFRTMNNCMDLDGQLLPDHERLTGLGKILRACSLDELPGLWNVLLGQMSIVGPRPLLMEYLPLYDENQSRRHDVKPGITGWAQVNGRNAISWSDKFDLDVWYVDNQSLLLDIKIILMTFKKVITRQDINAKGQATMSKFTGNKN